VRLEADANHSSEKARMREPRGAVMRSVNLPISARVYKVHFGGIGVYQYSQI
jgi:hypothetical protein